MRRLGILLIVMSWLWAGGPATGGYAGSFLRVGADARSAALAGALIAEPNGGFLALTNPASLVFVDKLEAGITYMALPLNRSLQSLSLAFHLPPTAAGGFSYLQVGDSRIQGRNSLGQPTEMLSYREGMGVLSFANNIIQHISLGLNVKVLFINLDVESTQGFSMDLGLLYRRPDGLSLAVLVRDVNGGYSWRVPAVQGERQYAERFPRIASAGMRLPLQPFTLFGQVDVVLPSEGETVLVYRVAAEDLVGDRLYVRGGLDHLAPTVGVGLRYSIRHQYDSRVDYALSLAKNGEGFGHLFTWMFRL